MDDTTTWVPESRGKTIAGFVFLLAFIFLITLVLG